MTFKTRILTGVAGIALLAAQAAQAQQVFDLGEIVVSGNLDAETLERIGATVSVVTGEELRQSAETRVIDYIARLPGVDVRSRGPIGTTSGVTIRGAGQAYVAVLVDGIDVTDVSGPQVAFDFGSLTTADIDRIEILRGGQSALYGSESIGGAINITTRRATEDGTAQFLTLESGSYNTLRGAYGLAVRNGPLDYALTLSRVQTDGFSAADENDGNTEADGFDATRLSFAMGYDLAGGARIGFNGFRETGSADFDEQFPIGDGNAALDEVTENAALGLRAFAEFRTGAVENEVSLTRYRIERRVTGSTDFGPDDNTYTGTRTGLAWLGTTAIGSGSDLRFGLDATREVYEQTGNYGPGEGENTVVGAFAELAWAPKDTLDLVGTLRYDEHSEFGGFLTGRLAGSWRPAPDWIVRTSMAQSYRAPSNYELFGPFGDPTLQPEESRSFDLGVERRLGADNFVRATLFYNETDNLIDFPFPYAQVPGTVTRRGAEVEAGARIGDAWRIDGSYSYTTGDNPDLTAGNAWNLEFPTHDLSVTVTGDLTDRLSAALSVQHVADRPTLGDYTVANATLTYEVAADVAAYLRVENLGDAEYQLLDGYGTSDRAYFAGIRAEF